MKLINLVIFAQDQKGDPLNVLSSIFARFGNPNWREFQSGCKTNKASV